MSDETPRRPTRTSTVRAALGLVLAGGPQPGAQDLRVERAGEAAVAGHEQQADRRSCARAPGGSAGCGMFSAASAAWRVMRRIAPA